MRSTPIMSLAVLAGTGPPGATVAVGAAPPTAGGEPAFQALLAMLLGAPATPSLAVSPMPASAEPAPAAPIMPERASASDPIQASLAGLAGLWFPMIAPASTASLPAPTASGADQPRPAAVAGLPQTFAPAELGWAPSSAGDEPTSGRSTATSQPGAPGGPFAGSAPTEPALPPARPALAGPAAGPPSPVASLVTTDTARSAGMVGPGASGRPERPVPPAIAERRADAVAPAAGAPIAVDEPLVVNQPIERVEARPVQLVQDDVSLAVTSAQSTPLAVDASATRPADDRRATAPAESPFGDDAVDTIVRQTRLLRAPGHTALRLHLRPADLGEVQVTIDVSARGATIHVASSNADGQAAIERGLPLLRGALEGAGLDPDRLTLTTSGGPSVTAGSAFDLSHQGRPRQDEAPARLPTYPGAPGSGGDLEEPTTRSAVAPRDGQLDIRA